MGRLRTIPALLALVGIALWNRLVTRGRSAPVPRTPNADPAIVEHERNWYDYLRGFHAHHGRGPRRTAGDRPEHGSF